MKLNKVLFSALFLSLSALVYSQGYTLPDFAVPDFPDDLLGTYMPILFMNEFERTNNYLEAMLINNNRYYDVICINKNIVYSNLKFHDQFAIKPNDVKSFTFNENDRVIELTDENGYKYIKISENQFYSRAYRTYINNQFFNILNEFHQNIIVKTDDGFIYNEKRWIIDLDIYFYPRDDNFMYYYEGRNGEFIGIQYINNEIIFYTPELDLEKSLASKNKDILLIIN
jgi:hypothetical protein